MPPCTTGAAFEAATVETAIAVDAVVSAEGCAACRGTFGIGSTRAAEGDITAASAGADRTTDTVCAVQSATALGAGRASTAFVPAAIEGTVAGYPVVLAEDRAPGLAALTRGGALATKTDGPATAAGGTADTICAAKPTAANRVPITPTSIVVTAVQNAVGVDGV